MKGILAAAAFLAGLSLACGRTRDMPEHVDVTDSMQVKRAIENMRAADSMLDTVPGGKMVRGDSAAMVRLLRNKM